jgi:predicted enzyme related to lactoylglutathione lyase
MVTMSPVVHFEMPAEDRRRMASFYEKTFGWKTQMLGPDMGDYVRITCYGVTADRRRDHSGENAWRA